MIVLAFAILASCTNEEEYPFRVRVVMEDEDYEGDDVRYLPVPLAHVRIAPDDPQSNVLFEGLTNNEGEVAFEYELEALFMVEAIVSTYDLDTTSFIDSTGYPATPPRFIEQIDTLNKQRARACSFIKLEEGKEVFLEVILEPWTPEEGLCF
jgi:hypothetical protein